MGRIMNHYRCVFTIIMVAVVVLGSAIISANEWQSTALPQDAHRAGGIVTFQQGRKAVVAVCGPMVGSDEDAVSIKNLDGPDERYRQQVVGGDWHDMNLVLYTWIPSKTARYRITAEPVQGGAAVFTIFNAD